MIVFNARTCKHEYGRYQHLSDYDEQEVISVPVMKSRDPGSNPGQGRLIVWKNREHFNLKKVEIIITSPKRKLLMWNLKMKLTPTLMLNKTS